VAVTLDLGGEDATHTTPLGSVPPWGDRFDHGATLFDGLPLALDNAL
jgi:hypothetical protein